uniref:Uncharacterized protein n=1 Tax=Glossina brevipalpis TaxID=37001 RepID=A0A1A9W647_9MUSC
MHNLNLALARLHALFHQGFGGRGMGLVAAARITSNTTTKVSVVYIQSSLMTVFAIVPICVPYLVVFNVLYVHINLNYLKHNCVMRPTPFKFANFDEYRKILRQASHSFSPNIFKYLVPVFPEGLHLRVKYKSKRLD